ncbi:MAG: hypothetical protein M1817_005774 [Caeruleum heppii]|nr:MAG: hypothetical protein M1817_005774 [Caeruleum heppii]
MTEPTSIQARIAALQLDQVGRSPETLPPSYAQSQSTHRATPTRSRAAPPPPRPSLPARPPPDHRRHTTENPPVPARPPRRIGAPTEGSRPDNQPIGTENDGTIPPPAIADDRGGRETRNGSTGAPPPTLPARRPSGHQARQPPLPPPSLPPRRPSERQWSRRSSGESTASTASALSVGTTLTSTSRSPSFDATAANGRVKAPPYDPTTLPALPTRRSGSSSSTVQAVTSQRAAHPLPVINGHDTHPSSKPATPARPQLPARRTDSSMAVGDSRRLPSSVEQQIPVRSALSFALNKSTESAPAVPKRPSTTSSEVHTEEQPPPIPFASRPSPAQLHHKSQPQLSSSPSAAPENCLKCRDFSAPDQHAARFPRESIPSTSIDWLSHELTAPFPSATDKARVIFTWLHHNVAYDVDSFFAGTVGPATPSSTLTSGLAVCAGYAGLFAALATKAGLECVVISGHGKGFGFTALTPGAPIPAYNAGHAWNAVRLADGAWHLVDACWGAGAVQGRGKPYVKRFAPTFFTSTNEEFGLRHFPGDARYFFRADGRVPSWEEYFLGETGGLAGVVAFAEACGVSALGESSFEPKGKVLSGADAPSEPIRFSFRPECPHILAKDSSKRPYLFILVTHPLAADPDKAVYVPFDTDRTFSEWHCTLPRSALGRSGQDLMVAAVTTVDGKDARGLERREWEEEVLGRKGIAFQGIAMWTVG